MLHKSDLLPLIISKAFLTATKSEDERIFARQHLVKNFLQKILSMASHTSSSQWPFRYHWYNLLKNHDRSFGDEVIDQISNSNLLKNHDRSFGDEVIDQISNSPHPFLTYYELLKILISIDYLKPNILILLSTFLLNSKPESFESTANLTLNIFEKCNLENTNLWIFTDLFWFFGLYSRRFKLKARFGRNNLDAKLRRFADRQLSGTDPVSQFHRMRISLVLDNPDLLTRPSKNCKTLMDSSLVRLLFDQVMALMWTAKNYEQ